MNKPQETICRIIVFLLKNKDFRSHIETKSKCSNFSYILNQTLRQYSEVNDSYEKTYQNINLYKKHHKWTERAVIAFEKNKELHAEHIVPISVITEKLLSEKNITFNKVCNVMKNYSEVIILSKEEAKVLDGSINKKYLLDGKKVNGAGKKKTGIEKERLKAINAKLHKDYINNSLHPKK